MINLMLGASGGGKSYESTVYQILPALSKGRKVITNLPLNVEAFAALDPAYGDLIDLRTKSRGPDVKDEDGELRPAPVFSHVKDYGDEWRNAKGQGPLYVIDEAHKPLPRGATSRAVEEWFAEHRHENADVVLITQSYGKLSAAITGNVQLVYRCRKAVAFGSMNRYIRKVQDGLRGEVVNTTVREYEPKFFMLYRSHTKGEAAEEWAAADVRPLWKHWSFIGAAVCAVVVVAIFSFGGASVNPVTTASAKAAASAPKRAASAPQPRAAQAAVAPASSSAPAPVSAVAAVIAPKVREPYEGRGLHLAGVIRQGDRALWSFVLSNNGQGESTLSDDELRAAGYVVEPLHDCLVRLRFADLAPRHVVCDAPKVTYGVPKLKS